MVNINSLTAGYDEPIIRNISMDIPRGQITGILGPNGSGKTTLALSILGFTKIYRGDITIEGKSIKRHKKDIRSMVSMLMQVPDNQLFARSVAEEIAIAPYKRGLPSNQVKEIVNGILSQIGLTHKKDSPPHNLSFGQKKRLAMGVLLSIDPLYYILDEPMAGLDLDGRNTMENIIVKLREKNKGIVLISHDLTSLTICDRLFIMHGGTLVKSVEKGDIPAILGELQQWNLYVPTI